MEHRHEDTQTIAIIGMACRFPDANDAAEFWQLLAEKASPIQEIPNDRWDWRDHYSATPQSKGKTNSKWGGFLDEIDKFDAAFFNIAPPEATLMDPQQRLMLELAQACIEDAGYNPQQLGGSQTGVFIGACNYDYKELQEQQNVRQQGHGSTGTFNTILPNRISFFFDFHGPSVPVDTSCSSSLVALHQAVGSLRNGECELALTGGVNLICSPTSFISFTQLGMLSPDGACKTFDAGANGYVRGEGAGLLLLKPLTAAIADNDHIYGVIKGTATNHGGRVRTLTTPNPPIQAEVIAAALQDAGLSAESISHIETHGTGTQLGDPVEVWGLKQAFKQTAASNARITAPYCGLGSVKANIGHLEAAAGIASVIKVLLAMQHRQLPGTPHFSEQNPRIDLEGSPFYILQDLTPWDSPEPLRAGVSSFGFGGANAHVVLEEYQQPTANSQQPTTNEPQLIVLSAKNEERLRGYVSKLSTYLGQSLLPAPAQSIPSLTNIAYTLQVGRDAMEERLAFVVTSVEELTERLCQYIQQQPDLVGIYRGNTKAKGLLHGTEQLIEGDAGALFINATINNRDLNKLAQLWVLGIGIDWSLLYCDQAPQRVSLPTYPFARVQHWIPTGVSNPINGGGSGRVETLHPFIHRNTSDLEAQRYQTTFTGTEFFLADHQVHSEKVLPGVAYLEMARAAGELALKGQTVTQLKNIVWAKPIVVTENPLAIEIGLYPNGQGEIDFEVRSEGQQEQVVHSQGKMAVAAVKPPATLDIRALQTRCHTTLDGATCYRHFANQGLAYGPAFHGLVELHCNDTEALARLQRPTGVATEGYGLHPTLLDAALQATVGLTISQNRHGERELQLPFALQRVTIYRPLPATLYAHVTYSPEVDSASTVKKYDITLADDQGAVCVTLQGFTMRAIAKGDAVSQLHSELLYFRPEWQSKPLSEEGDTSLMATKDLLLLVAGLEDDALADLAATFQQAEIIELALAGANDAIGIVQQSWQQVQAIVAQKPQTAHQVFVVAADTVARYLYAPLAGLLKTARLEQPNFWGKVITVTVPESTHLGSLIRREMQPHTFQEVEIRYDEAGNREVKALRGPADLSLEKMAYLKPGGVYWITGGLGGLGQIFARHLLSHSEAITVVLNGRSALTDVGAEQLAALNTLGGTVTYMQADVSIATDVERVVQTIRAEYGALNGILHSAGVIRDNFILNKTTAEIDDVLAPKVTGILNIDAITQAEPLDFLILFSSIASVLGNVGQADYAAANAFLDAFAHYRQTLVEAGDRSGHTLSINWPLWAEGGMTVDVETEKWLANRMDMHALSTTHGLQAFDQLLAQAGIVQCLVVQGDRAKLHQRLMAITPREAQPASSTAVADDSLQLIMDELIDICVELLKVPRADLDVETDLSEYGIDSILMMGMLNKLEARYGRALAPTAIVEHPTVKTLATYLIREGIAVQPNSPMASNEQSATTGKRAASERSASAMEQLSLGTKSRIRFRPASTLSGSGKVAIIGQACRLPQSPGLEQFWENLAAGRDLVTAIPADRWQPDERYANHGAFIDGVGDFDANYFGIANDEALAMDPQQRIVLELAQELLDRAGYHAEEIAGTKTCIFIGAKDNNYVRNHHHLIPPSVIQHTIVNSIGNMIAARVSDFYDLRGTAQVIDTACSSSLVAVHDACQNILSGAAEMAIAGGISLMVDDFEHLGFSRAKVLSPDSKSYVFDERANGFVLAEGGGLVLLKEYNTALRDGDQIMGVILGSAVNNDGQTMGLTVPNQEGQKDVIAAALQTSQVNPADISYLEAHGTGTLLGDPIEIRAATEVYQQYTQDKQYCGVGSVKSNLGHTMTAAGITGLIKLVLSLQHQQIPATLHCETPHPRFRFAESPFYPNTQLREWEPRNGRRVGAISSFGFGGTNCHLIVEEGRQADQTRHPMPLTQFQRKRYWLGQEIIGQENNSFNEAYYRKLIDDLQNGQLSTQMFHQLVTTY